MSKYILHIVLIIILPNLCYQKMNTVVQRKMLSNQNDLRALRQVFYTNLCLLTKTITGSIEQNIDHMKQRIDKHSTVPRLPYIHKLNLSEEEKVNKYIDQLRAFLPRIEQAILVERGITGDNFLSSLTLIKYDVMNIKATLRHFLRKMKLNFVKRHGKKIGTKHNSNRAETLGMLMDLRLVFILMNHELEQLKVKTLRKQQ